MMRVRPPRVVRHPARQPIDECCHDVMLPPPVRERLDAYQLVERWRGQIAAGHHTLAELTLDQLRSLAQRPSVDIGDIE